MTNHDVFSSWESSMSWMVVAAAAFSTLAQSCSFDTKDRKRGRSDGGKEV